jgi:hypothetical protein
VFVVESVVVGSVGAAVAFAGISVDRLLEVSPVMVVLVVPAGGTVCGVVWAMAAAGRAAAISQRAVLVMIKVRRLVGQG